MATQKQIDANRRNAQKSTGPKTDAGKASSKFNSLKHGMTAATAVLPYEDPHAYVELREALISHYAPANPIEAMLVETVANAYWRLLRVRRVETATITLGIRGLEKRHDVNLESEFAGDGAIAVLLNQDKDTLRNVERHQARIERCYFQAIEALRKAQKDRLREERLTTAQPAKGNGFVPRTSETRPPQAAAAASAMTVVPDPPATETEPRYGACVTVTDLEPIVR